MPSRDSSPSVPAALRPFDGQRPSIRLLFVALGVALWSAAFLAVVALQGGADVATLDTSAALGARQRGGVVASVLVGAYFGAGIAAERGGPVSNLLYAPLAAAVGATGLPILLAYGETPRGVLASPAASASLAWGGAGELAVFATAAVGAGAVAAVHYAVVAGPVGRERLRERYGALPGVHLGPDPLADWRADGGRDEGAEDAAGAVEGGDD